MKTFEDLQFKEHAMVKAYRNIGVEKRATHAVMNFPNGYGISVICGEDFYSNGKDEYEVAVLQEGCLCYSTPITDDVLGYQTKEEISKIMKELQSY